MKRAILVGACLLVAGCGPWISPLTAPPPSGVAEFHYSDDLIRVSEGVAYAFECSDNGPCTDLVAESADPRIALAYVGHLTMPAPWSNVPRNVTAFVVVGQNAGRTSLTVHNGTSTKKYVVEVLPALQSSPAAASPLPPVPEASPTKPTSAPPAPVGPSAPSAGAPTDSSRGH